MKKKIIGISVATVGVLLSIGSAIALYEKAASNAEFNISAGAYAGATGEVTYSINDQAGESTVNPVYCDAEGNPNGTGISANATQLKYVFELGAGFSDELEEQPFVMGQVSVALTHLKAALYGKVTVYAHLDGYQTGKIGYSAFGETPLINDVTIADADTVCAGSRDVSVMSTGGQSLVVWVKFANFDNYALDELDDLFDLEVSWGKVSNDFQRAYVIGDGTQWNKDDKYAMAVNIQVNTYTWAYYGLPGTFGNMKVVCGDNWCHDGDNHALDPAETYSVFWTAGSDLILSAD